MPEDVSLNKEQLIEKYPDPEWQKKLIEIIDISTFLDHCIISADYKVPDEIGQVIPLSTDGEKVFRELTRQSVPAKEARLLCLVELVHVDPLIDINRIDTNRLADFIGAQIKSKELRLPMTWGTAAYQRAAELFTDERRSLSLADTFRLLDELPIGVFQAGNWTGGPWGLVRSEIRRNLYPNRSLPLQHCHDLTCSTVHHVVLDTASAALVNQNRHKITHVLNQRSTEASEWGAFLSEVLRDDKNRFDDQNSSTLPVLLADAFSEVELKVLINYLLDNTQGKLRQRLSSLSRISSAHEWSQSLSRAELLQIIFLVEDEKILHAVDFLTFSGSLNLPQGEVRRSPLRAKNRSGAFHVQAQLSCYGIRFSSLDGLGPLQLRRLIDLLYPIDSEDARDELDWQLRSIEGMSIASRLDEYLRTERPSEVISKLVFARRASTTAACKSLNLEQNPKVNDATMLRRMLWKLGFEVAPEDDLRDRFWSAHEGTVQAAKAAGISSILDEEALRGTVANYFVELERLLDDTLVFVTWLFLSDHIRQTPAFTFDEITCREFAFLKLQEYANDRATDKEHDILTYGDKNTLYPLSRGFHVLAEALGSLKEVADDYLRPDTQLPDYRAETTLQRFPFIHMIAFLDLIPSSQDDIIDLLKEVSAALISGKVSEVRNEQLHFRKSTADLDRLLACLGSVENAVRKLDDAGLTRVLYAQRRRESDSWGRSTVYMSDTHGREIAFGRPNSYEWLRLPILNIPQYIVTCAQFAEPNEPLRISRSTDSEFTRMWADFPRYARASTRGGASMSNTIPDSPSTNSIAADIA